MKGKMTVKGEMMKEKMTMKEKSVFALFFFFLYISRTEAAENNINNNNVYITIAYCPDYFHTLGAIISVDSSTGNFSLVGKFAWPQDAILGCAALYDPIVTYDSNTSYLYLDITEDFGEVITLDVMNAKVIGHAQPRDEFFIGYENMGYDASSLLLQGLSPTATKNGEGAYQFGSLDPSSGLYSPKDNIPFKEITDDAHYMADGVYWVQAGYDTRSESESCSPNNDAALCLLAIDVSTGSLLNSTLTSSFTVYKYASSLNENGTLLCFAYGFDTYCNDPYNDFLFLNLNLSNASAQPIACISKSTIIQEEEWISSFSEDNSMLAQGSCYGGESQFLVFDTHSGATLVNSSLDGLSDLLGAIDGQMFFWSVDFNYN